MKAIKKLILNMETLITDMVLKTTRSSQNPRRMVLQSVNGASSMNTFYSPMTSGRTPQNCQKADGMIYSPYLKSNLDYVGKNTPTFGYLQGTEMTSFAWKEPFLDFGKRRELGHPP